MQCALCVKYVTSDVIVTCDDGCGCCTRNDEAKNYDTAVKNNIQKNMFGIKKEAVASKPGPSQRTNPSRNTRAVATVMSMLRTGVWTTAAIL